MRGDGRGARAWADRGLFFLPLLILAGCDGGGGEPDVCEGYLCSGHGTCVDQAGEPVCVCDPGYTRADCGVCAAGYHDDGAGNCVPDVITCQPDSCSGHGTCDDSTGAIVCTCDAGYAGDACEGCAGGYHDDGSGACVPDSPTCQADSCNLHGTCDDSTGAIVCTCDAGYEGDACERCAVGYHDDGSGACVLDTPLCQAGSCSGHGTCDDSTGAIVCTCDDGYAGDACERCATGYQDHDGDGTCLPGCGIAGLDCGPHGLCDDAGGTATCVCVPGYTGADCQACAAGYQDHDQDGSCLPTCVALGWTCSGHGTCDDSSGEAACACDTGYEPGNPGQCVPSGTGQSCASPRFLDLGARVVAGDTRGTGNEAAPSCQATSSAPEVVYVFEIAQPVLLTFSTDGAFDSVLYLRRDCAGGPDLACNDDGPAGVGSRLSHAFTQAGSYYLFVDGYAAEAGPYQLRIESECEAGTVYDPSTGACVDDPCTPDPCLVPHQTRCLVALPSFLCACEPGYTPDGAGGCAPDLDAQGEGCADAIPLLAAEGQVAGSTAGAQPDASASCGAGATGPDRVYAFSAQVAVRAHFETDGLYDSVLHLRSSCEDPGAELECDDDSGAPPGSAFTQVLPAGSYSVWVDTYGGKAGGPYTLSYSLRPDPCADEEGTCPGQPECRVFPDWTGFTCECPAGSLAVGGACVPDPCATEPCPQATHQGRCVVDDAAAGTFHCECSLGYLPDGADPDLCVLDPDANEWAVLVFLSADNNLESYGFADLAEMGAAGSTADVHIAALIDTYAGSARVVYVTPGGYDVLSDEGELDMGDWRVLRDFGVWAVQSFPARHHALILWDHGDGWTKAARPPPPVLKGFSGDEHGTAGGISVARGDLGRALAGITTALGGRLDILGFDACLMGMWEVAHEAAPYADLLVASEESEPGTGWAYDGFLPALVADPAMTPLELGTAIADSYQQAGQDDSTLSVIDLATLADLELALTGLADAALAHPESRAAVLAEARAAQGFAGVSSDLRDFAARLAAAGVHEEIGAAAQALVTRLGATVLVNRVQADHPGAFGLAAYLPTWGVDPAYAEAAWAAATSWDELLVWLNP